MKTITVEKKSNHELIAQVFYDEEEKTVKAIIKDGVSVIVDGEMLKKDEEK